MNKKGKFFWILIGIGLFIIFVLMIVSSVIEVGERLRSFGQVVEITFYVLCAFVFYFLIVNPIRIILFSPSFSIQTTFDKDNGKSKKVYKKVALNMLKNPDLSEEDKELLKEGLKDRTELKHQLQHVFDHSIKNSLNKIIIKNAKTVMVSTAISQNGRLDLFTVMAVNIKMIKELVVKCGFRPSFKNLGKLTANVFVTALIAEGLEDLDFNEIFPNSTTNFLSDIPFIKPIASSIMQGISNALLTIRVGIVTRKYLFSDGKEITKQEVRKYALKESLKILPVVIKQSLSVFPDRIKKMFTPKKHANEAESN
ncbi:MAG: DUF697 domain-containing protein [Bacilli bacterium]|jgi:uncharacterized membrane protein